MQFLYFIVAIATATPLIHAMNASEKMCQKFNGKLETLQVASYKSSEQFEGLKHSFCIANFNASKGSIYLDGTSSLTTATVASNFVKHIPLVNFQKILAENELRAGNSAAILCAKLNGAQITDVNLDYGFKNKKGELTSFCVFGDGSMADEWALIYSSLSVLSKDRETVHAKARSQIPNEMVLNKIAIDFDLFIDPIELTTCKDDADCQNATDPCNSKASSTSCDKEQGVCVAKVSPKRCKSNDDCTGTSLRKSYAQDGQGYCVPQQCNDAKVCVFDQNYNALN